MKAGSPNCSETSQWYSLWVQNVPVKKKKLVGNLHITKSESVYHRYESNGTFRRYLRLELTLDNFLSISFNSPYIIFPWANKSQ